MKEKQCVICKEPILEDKEKWVRLTDFNCGVQSGETFYHLECWQERFKITNSQRKQKMYSEVMRSLKTINDKMNKGGIVAQ